MHRIRTYRTWETDTPTDWQRGLTIVVHPDDLEYGAAGAVAAWTSEGREIAYVLVTRGEAGIDGMAPDRAGPLGEAEQRAGAAEVGVHTVELLDHRAVGWVVLDAAADAGNRWIFPDVAGPEPWGGARWVAVASSLHGTHAVDVSAHLDRAVATRAPFLQSGCRLHLSAPELLQSASRLQ